jgi:hypothetical protein
LPAPALGVLRLDHDAGKDDDRAVSLGLAALVLTEHTDTQSGGFSIPSAILANRRLGQLGRVSIGPRSAGSLNPAYLRTASRGSIAGIAAAQQNQTEARCRAGLRLVVPGRANDPSR